MDMKLVKGRKVYENLIEATHDNQLDVKRDWRLGQPGDWVISDCGKVLEVLKIAPGFVCTITGQYMVRARKGMYIDKTHEPKSDPKQIHTTIKRKEFARQYTIFFDVYKAFSRVYTTNTDSWKKRARRVFNQPDVQSEIEKRMKGMLSELNIDDKYFLTNLKRMVEEGNKPSQLEALRALKSYREDVLKTNEDRDSLLRGLGDRIEDAEFVLHEEDDGKEDEFPDSPPAKELDTPDNTGKGSEDILQT